MKNWISRCPFCQAKGDKITNIFTTGVAIAKAYACGSFAYMADKAQVYSKRCDKVNE